DVWIVRNLLTKGRGIGIRLLSSAAAGTASALIADNRLKDWLSNTHLINAMSGGAKHGTVRTRNNHCTGRDLAFADGGTADQISLQHISELIMHGDVSNLGGDL